MKRSGCSMVGAASNHTFDYDQSYIDGTISAFINDRIAIAGMNTSKQNQSNITTISVDGLQCAVLSYTTYSNIDAPPQNDYGVNIFSEALASTQIATAKKQGMTCIIASMRWGTEFSSQVTAQQETQAKWLVDNGVRLVLGHGTHVVQKVDVLQSSDGKKSAVLYGLGNFINSQIPSDTVTGCVFDIPLNRQTLEPKEITCRPIYNAYEWSASDKQTDNLLARRKFRMLPLSQATDEMMRSQQLNTTVAGVRSNLETVLARGNYKVNIKD
jgi:poly-gamma-glutamate capsule biosynthesis protein CapA/YwtB (metallophosphatase superfamily)